jgi:hypothetical protein
VGNSTKKASGKFPSEFRAIKIYQTVQSRIRDPAGLLALNPPDCESGRTQWGKIVIG